MNNRSSYSSRSRLSMKQQAQDQDHHGHEPTRKSCKRRWWGGSVSTGTSAAESGLAQLSPRGGLLRRRQRVSKERTCTHAPVAGAASAERAETELVTLVSGSGHGHGSSSGSGQFFSTHRQSLQTLKAAVSKAPSNGLSGSLHGHPDPLASAASGPSSRSLAFHPKRRSRQPQPPCPMPTPTPIRRPVARRLTFDSLADVCVEEPPRLPTLAGHVASLPTRTPPTSRAAVPFKHNSWEGLPLDLKVVCLSYLGQQGWTKYAHLSHSAQQASDRCCFQTLAAAAAAPPASSVAPAPLDGAKALHSHDARRHPPPASPLSALMKCWLRVRGLVYSGFQTQAAPSPLDGAKAHHSHDAHRRPPPTSPLAALMKSVSKSARLERLTFVSSDINQDDLKAVLCLAPRLKELRLRDCPLVFTRSSPPGEEAPHHSFPLHLDTSSPLPVNSPPLPSPVHSVTSDSSRRDFSDADFDSLVAGAAASSPRSLDVVMATESDEVHPLMHTQPITAVCSSPLNDFDSLSSPESSPLPSPTNRSLSRADSAAHEAAATLASLSQGASHRRSRLSLNTDQHSLDGDDDSCAMDCSPPTPTPPSRGTRRRHFTFTPPRAHTRPRGLMRPASSPTSSSPAPLLAVASTGKSKSPRSLPTTIERLELSTMYIDPNDAFLQDLIRNSPKLTQLTLRRKDSFVCSSCGAYSLSRYQCCSGCLLVNYCDPACQRADWKKHQFVCPLARYPDDGGQTSIFEVTDFRFDLPDSLRASILSCANLEAIDLSYTFRLFDSDVRALVERCPKLTSVKLNGCEDITGQSLGYIGESLPGIRVLHVKSCRKITGYWLQQLSHCKELRELNVGRCYLIDERSIERFIESGFPHMRSLNIATGIRAGKILWGITDELMQAMARGCARLQQLSFIVEKSLPQRTIERFASRGVHLLWLEPVHSNSSSSDVVDPHISTGYKPCIVSSLEPTSSSSASTPLSARRKQRDVTLMDVDNVALDDRAASIAV